MLTAQEIMKKIMENKNEIKSFGVKRIGLFGSYAKNEQKETSDIDSVSYTHLTLPTTERV